MNIAEYVKIVEVAPRDGLQNEAMLLSTMEKMEFISLLSNTGLTTIEAASFVSPKLVPQMADSRELLAGLNMDGSVKYPVLVPNEKGYHLALQAGAREISIIASASETFSQKNSNCSREEGVQRCLAILHRAESDGLDSRGYIPCALGCPYEGEVTTEQVLNVAEKLLNGGCTEIVIADTIGKATPLAVQDLIGQTLEFTPLSHIAVHFHDTYGQGLANIFAALQLGVSIVDSSAAGLGGCPFAQGASGNVATEDLLFMLEGMGVTTGVDLKAVQKAGDYVCQKLGRTNGSKLATAQCKTI